MSLKFPESPQNSGACVANTHLWQERVSWVNGQDEACYQSAPIPASDNNNVYIHIEVSLSE